MRTDIRGEKGVRSRHTESSVCLTQKIMMPANFWCDHAEGFESGLRAWELDVGERERASGTVPQDAVKYTVMMNMAPIFRRSNLQLGTHANSAFFRTVFSQKMVLLFPKLWRIATVSAGNGTGADDDNRVQVDSLHKGNGKGKGKHPNKKGTHTCKQKQHRHQHMQELWLNGTLGERLLETRWRSIRQLKQQQQQQQQQHMQGQEPQEMQRLRQTVGRGANESAFRNSPPTLWYPSQTSSTIDALWCNPDVQQKRSDHASDNQFSCLSQGDELVRSVCCSTVVQSFTHVRSSM